jgi:hypothetical protein
MHTFRKKRLSTEIYNDRFSLNWPQGIATECDYLFCEGSVRVAVDEDRNQDQNLVCIALKNSLTIVTQFENAIKRIPNAVLVFCCTDATFPEQSDVRYPKPNKLHLESLMRVLDSPNVRKAFMANLDTTDFHAKSRPIPIGLANEWGGYPTDLSFYSQHSVSHQIRSRFQSKTKKVSFMNRTYTGNGQWADRVMVKQYCERYLSDLVSVFDGNMPYMEFIHKLSDLPFTICVHGGGIDPCPKAWESILIGTIPIVKRYPSLMEAYDGLPMMVVDEFNSDHINNETLSEAFNKYVGHFEDPALREAVVNKCLLQYWVKKMLTE